MNQGNVSDSAHPPGGIGRLKRLLYASGVVSYALKDAAFGAFVLFYYKQVLGLSGTLTGVAIAISILWDAVSDPLVGAWSDRSKHRFGRRHPFMIASLIPLAISFVCLFSPPESVQQSSSSLFVWLLVSVIALRTGLTFFMVPYLALGAELSSDYDERTRLSSVRTNLGWFVGVMVPTSSLVLIFADTPAGDGRFMVANYQNYGWLSAAGVLLFCSICIRGTWSYIASLPKADETPSGSFWRDLMSVFRNADFRYLVILDTAIGGMAGVVGALLMVTYTYFWELSTAQISLLFGGPPVIAVLLVTFSSDALNKRFEKQQLLRLSCTIIALNLLWLTPMQLFGLLPANEDLVFLLVFVNYAIHVSMVILRTVENYSLLADVADAQELSSGKRQEGVMFAAAFFAAKFVSGFGYLVAGPYLDFIGLQSGALPGETPASVSWGLGLIMGPGLALLMLIPVWMAFKLKLSRSAHAAVREALASR